MHNVPLETLNDRSAMHPRTEFVYPDEEEKTEPADCAAEVRKVLETLCNMGANPKTIGKFTIALAIQCRAIDMKCGRKKIGHVRSTFSLAMAEVRRVFIKK